MSENLNKLSIRKGFTFYRWEKNQTPYKCHVLEVIKDEGERIVVFKWYGKHKQWWHYEIINKRKLLEWLGKRFYTLTSRK